MTTPGADAPQYLAARTHDRLAADDRLAALDVDVRIVGRKVFLVGSVNTSAQQDAARELVQRELPGYEVHNELVLVECTEGSASDSESLT
jgi:osmotically-inducible protein OsmY